MEWDRYRREAEQAAADNDLERLRGLIAELKRHKLAAERARDMEGLRLAIGEVLAKLREVSGVA